MKEPAAGRRAGAYSVAIMTSVALMITETRSPSLRLRRSRDESVIAAVTSPASTLTVTSAMIAPDLTVCTVPLNWFRALSCIAVRPSVGVASRDHVTVAASRGDARPRHANYGVSAEEHSPVAERFASET